jgi:FkbM family methyltransferase
MDKNHIRKIIKKTQDIVIFEVGAADGKDSAGFLHTFRDVDMKLYCFEPDDRNIKSFKALIHEDPHVTLVEKAIGEHSQKNVEWFKSHKAADNPGLDCIYSSSLRAPYKCTEEWPVLNFQKTHVDMISLDDFVEQNGITHIDFLWADVQGAEDLLIKGGRKTLESKVTFFYTEYGNVEYYHGQPTLQTIRALLPTMEMVADFRTDVLFANPKLLTL